MSVNYDQFLKSKVVVADKFGFETDPDEYSAKLFPHQKDIIKFALDGGRRAIFASFGLGKTFIQLEIARQCIIKYNKPFLIVCPLGVSGEFKRDNKKLSTGFGIDYITDTDDFTNETNVQIYLTNYERIRKGDINPECFCGVSFDEASILRNLQTETAYKAIEMNRKAVSVELNSEYFNDGLCYIKAKLYHMNVPTLFDMISQEKEVGNV